MSKPVKDMMTCEIRTQYEGVDSVCVIDITPARNGKFVSMAIHPSFFAMIALVI